MRHALLALLALVSGSAEAALYHLELSRPHHGPALVDCDRGFGPALDAYFTDFARGDGVPATGSPTVVLGSPKARISRFRVQFSGGRSYEGFVFRDPTMSEAEDEVDEEEATDAPVCSAVFASGDATLAERQQLEDALTALLERLGQEPPPPLPAAAPPDQPFGSKR
ncbi:MAG: hypothetical protein ACYCWW_21020 [Deltaproteobacteria bacterium]